MRGRALEANRGAIRLSAHVLAEDAGLLAGQLWGRLSDAWTPETRGLLDQAKKGKVTPWLRPLNSGLRHPADQLVRTLAGHTDEVRAAVLTPDGRRAISASADHTLKVWDLETGKEIHTLRGHSGTVDAVAVFPDGKRAISAASDQTLKLWDLQAGVELLSLTDTTPAHGLAVSPDGRFVISAGADWMLKVWDVQRASSAKRPTRRALSAKALAITPDGQQLVLASPDRTLRLLDWPGQTELSPLGQHSGDILTIAVTPDSRRAITMDGEIKVWDLVRGKQERTVRVHTQLAFGALAIASDGQLGVSGVWGQRMLQVWSVEDGQVLSSLPELPFTFVRAIAITPDGRRVIAGGQDRQVIVVWDVPSRRRLFTLDGHHGGVNALAVTPDGRRLISGSQDTTLKVWDLERGSELGTWSGHRAGVTAVDLTPDGRRVVSAAGLNQGADATLRVWDVDSGQLMASFVGESAFAGCTVAPDGVTVLARDPAARVHLFRLENFSSAGAG